MASVAMQSLYWLLAKHSISYKMAVLAHKVLLTSMPSYLKDMLDTV